MIIYHDQKRLIPEMQSKLSIQKINVKHLNRINTMISTDEKKHLTKIQQTFHDENAQQTRSTKGTSLLLIDDIDR